ncbi:MAG TPA: 3-oxoacyl-[acyl-carrier-protein] synthase III C-terminal domain-containing protein [Terrimicrobiaceae bacterium]
MKILHVAHALPSKKVTNQDLIDEMLRRNRARFSDNELKELQQRMLLSFRFSGTEVRYHRAEGEKAFTIGMRAGQLALKRSGVSPTDVDLLIYAGVGRGWLEPAMANIFQAELGLTRATCFDVLDACASWIRSLQLAKALIAAGAYRTVMILNCELNFREYANFDIDRMEDLEHAFSAFTIGEAATATLLTSEPDRDDFVLSFRTSGDKWNLCHIPLSHADDFVSAPVTSHCKPMSFYTSPRELMAVATSMLGTHFNETPALRDRAYDLLIGHEVSLPTTRMVTKLLNIDPAIVFSTHSRFGNTVSASLPLNISIAEEEGRLKRGMQVLLAMGSAGVTSAFCAFQY